MFDLLALFSSARPGTRFEAAQDPEIERSRLLAEASATSSAALGRRDLGSRERRGCASRQLRSAVA
jgi:hypothetical protein